jgi:hypothetical protein
MKTPFALTLAVFVLVPAPAALADGCPAPCSGQSSSPPNAKYLYVQRHGPLGPVSAYDTASARVAFSTPAGASSADGRWHISAAPARGRTTIVRYTLRTGRIVNAVSVAGSWKVAALSPTGRWAAMARAGSRTTQIAVVDMVRGTVVQDSRLHGRFEVEAVSADGKRMFLIEHLSDVGYLVRLFDVARNELVTQALKASGDDAPMIGYAWGGVASPEGRWLLTLYLNTHHNHAFVHALDIEKGVPFCIGLPSGRGRLSALERYTLTLSPDGRTLYAANAALGAVTTIELASQRVVREVRFRPATAGLTTKTLLAGTISRNGRTLYFSAGSALWAYDAAYGVVRGPYSAGGRIVGFGYGARDRTIHALRTDGRMVTFDAATGRRR